MIISDHQVLPPIWTLNLSVKSLKSIKSIKLKREQMREIYHIHLWKMECWNVFHLGKKYLFKYLQTVISLSDSNPLIIRLHAPISFDHS